jgi:S1-C subfamily serine protease
METETEPLLTPADASSQASASTLSSGEVDPAPADPAVSSANRAGEPIDPASVTSSSRPKRDRWLAGVLAVSLLSATAASAVTVGALAGAGYIGGSTAQGASASVTAASTTPSANPVAISTSDAVVAVAEKASPAVVTITVESAGSGGFGPGSLSSTGIGSGFIFDADGLILTNNHVIKGSGAITVTLKDGTEYPGSVVSADAVHDLAVVRVKATGLPTIAIGDASKLQVGQLVVAIGSPLGTFTETVTSGILSATGRTIDVGSSTSRQTTHMTGLLQTDAAINEGNSGGPLLDANGTVIGLDVAVATSAQGIGFAVPISDAATIMAEARATTSAT